MFRFRILIWRGAIITRHFVIFTCVLFSLQTNPLRVVVFVDAAEPEAISEGVQYRVSQLTAELNAPTRHVREESQQILESMGAEILPLLTTLLPTVKGEAAFRLRAICSTLEAAETLASVEPTTLSFHRDNVSITELFADVESRSGNTLPLSLTLLEHSEKTMPLSVSFQRSTYWETIDSILAQAKLALLVNDIGALVTLPENDADDENISSVAAGLLRITVRDSRSIWIPSSPEKRIKLMLEILWEPRLQPLLLRFPMVSVFGDGPQGQSFSVGSRAATLEAVVHATPGWTSFPVVLDVPAHPSELSLLRGTIHLWLLGREHPFTFKKLGPFLTDNPSTESMGSAHVTLEGIQVVDDVAEVIGSIRYATPSEALDSHHTWLADRAMTLISPDGTRHTSKETTVLARDTSGMRIRSHFDVDHFSQDFLECSSIEWRLPLVIHNIPVDFALRDISLPPKNAGKPNPHQDR